MAVPKYIREDPRTVNNVVIDNGKDGPTRYAVRERKGVQYVPGGNPQPQNGRVIGHIVTVFEELEALGLSKLIPKPEPKKLGRPSKDPGDEKPKRP